MPEIVYILLFAGLLICCALCLCRVGFGPTSADRMVAVDILGTVVVGFVAISVVLTGKGYLMNVAIVWALLSFIGTMALSKHLEGREFDE